MRTLSAHYEKKTKARIVFAFLILGACLTSFTLIGCADDDEVPSAEMPIVRDTPPLPAEYHPSDDEFMVVFLPDTQIYSERFPETFVSQTQWIAEYADEYNIKFVAHVGDIVQSGDREMEWSNANAAFDWIKDIDMPHGVAFASHDETRGSERLCDDFENPRCRAAKFIEYFGPQNYADKEWYRGASPSETSSYQVVDAGPFELLFLFLPQDPPRAEIEWGKEVLDAHPDKLAHVITHRYLFDYRLTAWLPSPLGILQSGRFFEIVYALGGQSLKYEDSVDTYTLFDQLIAESPNVWSVHCGHVDGELNIEWPNAQGNPVYENLIDFQDMADGGGGWLRVLLYKPSENKVEAITFSTVSGEIRQNGDGFEHSVDIVKRYRQAYADDLASLGLDDELIDSLLERVSQPGPDRDAYYDSLYSDGIRMSRYTMDVDFAAYIGGGN